MRSNTLYSDWQKILDNIDLKSYKTSHLMLEPDEVVVQCPGCNTMETVEVVGDTLLRCKKFYQRERDIYHDCGSTQPCILHH